MPTILRKFPQTDQGLMRTIENSYIPPIMKHSN